MILLERVTGGVVVALAFERGAMILSATTECVSRSVEVPKAEGLEAFYHPALYLTDPLEVFS
jgi:hypothetical protein